MARICFTWELGSGLGHLVRYRNLIAQLKLAGHDVQFLSRCPARAEQIFGHAGISIFPLEPGFTPESHRLKRPETYAGILRNKGFFSAQNLAAQIRPSHDHFKRYRPDLLIADHSPSVLLANRITKIPAISSGTGFTVPPHTVPLPAFRPRSIEARALAIEYESAVVEVCNRVLADFGMNPLANLTDLLTTEREWLLSFPELDHYGVRPDARYLGNFPATDFGEQPDWAAGGKVKVFIYLVSKHLPESLARALDAADASVCFFAPNLDDRTAQNLGRPNWHRTQKPLCLADVAESADVVISNGGLNTVSAFLMAGLPQLVLADNMERAMVARRLELLGAGLALGADDAQRYRQKFRAACTDRAMRRNAARFARIHSHESAAQQTETMLRDIDELLGNKPMGTAGQSG